MMAVIGATEKRGLKRQLHSAVTDKGAQPRPQSCDGPHDHFRSSEFKIEEFLAPTWVALSSNFLEHLE